MPPLLHLVRHAQGWHNVKPEGSQLRDPLLTPQGEEQCEKLRQGFPHHETIDLLMASPIKRAVQTCEIAFKPELERGLVILAMPMAQEASADPCDTGSSPEELHKFTGGKVDLHRVKDHWNEKHGFYATDPDHLIERARKLRCYVKARPEREAVLVSHGYFAHVLTGEYTRDGEQTTGWWKNAEWRTYEFVEEDDEHARLVETKESLNRRGVTMEQAKAAMASGAT